MSELNALPQHWYAACRSRDIGRNPVACTLWGKHIVLFRDADGVLSALLDRCPHRNVPLSQGTIRNGRLACPYHGWEFDRIGECQAVPGLCGPAAHASRQVASFPAAEQDGLAWVCLAPPETKAPPRIEVAGAVMLAHEFTLQASLFDGIENFLDATHTHFVHAGLVRTESARRVVQTIVRRGPGWAQAEYLEEKQSGWIARLFGAGITRSVGRFVLPSTVQLEYWAGTNLKLLITLYFTPRTPSEQHVFAVVAARVGVLPGWLVKWPFVWMLRRAVRQDQRILALQSANLRRFGGPRYVSTELDVLRPHISALLGGATFAESEAPRHITMRL